MRPASHKNIGLSTVHFRIESKGNWEEYGQKVEKLLKIENLDLSLQILRELIKVSTKKFYLKIGLTC